MAEDLLLLEELDSALREGPRSSTKKRKSRSALVVESDAGTGASSAAAAGAAAAAASSVPPVAPAIAAASLDASVPTNELTHLRAENAALREQLARAGAGSSSAAASAAASSSASHLPRLSERPKVSIAYQNVSHRVRKYIDTLIIQAELDDSRSSVDNDDDEERLTIASVSGASSRAAHAPVQYFESFCIDRAGQRKITPHLYQPLDAQLFDVPTYEGPINVVPLPVKRSDANANELDVFAMLGSCFNCGAAHQIRECPHPRDEACIRMNTMLFREFAQGRTKDGRLRSDAQQQPGGGGGGSSYSGRYYTEESLKPEVEETAVAASASAATASPLEDGEIAIDDDDESVTEIAKPNTSSVLVTTAAAGSSIATDDADGYFMHDIHPAIKHPPTASLLASLPKSDLQVIDKEEDELVMSPPPEVASSPTKVVSSATPGDQSSSFVTPSKPSAASAASASTKSEEVDTTKIAIAPVIKKSLNSYSPPPKITSSELLSNGLLVLSHLAYVVPFPGAAAVGVVLNKIYTIWNAASSKDVWLADFIVYLRNFEIELIRAQAAFAPQAYSALAKQLTHAQEVVERITTQHKWVALAKADADQAALAQVQADIERIKAQALLPMLTELKASRDATGAASATASEVSPLSPEHPSKRPRLGDTPSSNYPMTPARATTTPIHNNLSTTPGSQMPPASSTPAPAAATPSRWTSTPQPSQYASTSHAAHPPPPPPPPPPASYASYVPYPQHHPPPPQSPAAGYHPHYPPAPAGYPPMYPPPQPQAFYPPVPQSYPSAAYGYPSHTQQQQPPLPPPPPYYQQPPPHGYPQAPPPMPYPYPPTGAQQPYPPPPPASVFAPL